MGRTVCPWGFPFACDVVVAVSACIGFSLMLGEIERPGGNLATAWPLVRGSAANRWPTGWDGKGAAR
jgi:hypothetical protein